MTTTLLFGGQMSSESVNDNNFVVWWSDEVRTVLSESVNDNHFVVWWSDEM
jgi:hypothetical protein